MVAGALHLNHAVEHAVAHQLPGIGEVNVIVVGVFYIFFCRIHNIRPGELLKLLLVCVLQLRTLGENGIDILTGELLLKRINAALFVDVLDIIPLVELLQELFQILAV